MLRSTTRPEASETLGIRLPQNPERCWQPSHPCWLLLYLPGFDSTVDDFGERLAPSLDRAEAAGAPPVIAATLDPRTHLGGGFYVDSLAAGNWETFVVSRLVPALQALVPGTPPDHLLVIGHSMGGFGALYLTLHHPSLFTRAGALSPALRPEVMANALLPVVERSHGAAPLDPAPFLQSPTTARFPERLVWAMLAAFDPSPPPASSWASQVITAQSPWHLELSAARQLEKLDLTESNGLTAKAWAGASSIYLSDGRRDRLIPTADVEAFAANARAHGAAADRVVVDLHEGDHINHLPADLQAAVVDLTRP
jgi:S-formylglutathione hydrolase FrmB